MSEKKELRLTVTNKPDSETDWWVHVEGRGFPDFTIKAGNADAARETLAGWVYNELDGAEDVVDDDSLMP